MIVRYFGATHSFTSITDADVSRLRKNLVRRLKIKEGIKEVVTDRNRKNTAIWHYITDLPPLYNWAIHKRAGECLAD